MNSGFRSKVRAARRFVGSTRITKGSALTPMRPWRNVLRLDKALMSLIARHAFSELPSSSVSPTCPSARRRARSETYQMIDSSLTSHRMKDVVAQSIFRALSDEFHDMASSLPRSVEVRMPREGSRAKCNSFILHLRIVPRHGQSYLKRCTFQWFSLAKESIVDPLFVIWPNKRKIIAAIRRVIFRISMDSLGPVIFIARASKKSDL